MTENPRVLFQQADALRDEARLATSISNALTNPNYSSHDIAGYRLNPSMHRDTLKVISDALEAHAASLVEAAEEIEGRVTVK